MPPFRRRSRLLLCVLTLWCFGALLAGSAGVASARPELPGVAGSALGEFFGPRGYTAVRLRRAEGNHLEIEAKINGRTGLFLLDTGAQITVVHRGALQKFRLTSVKTSVRVYGALGGPGEQIQAALASTVQLGPCRVSPFLLGVSDLSTLNQGRGRAGRFDGIIGADLLQNFAFVVDCQGPQLFARDIGSQPGTTAHPELGAFLKNRGFTEVPMRRQAISDFEISVDVNRRRAVLLVDTGAAITLLDSDLSRRAGIDLRRTDLTVGGAGGGRQRIAIGVVKNLQLSSLRVRSAAIAVSEISTASTQLTDAGKPALDGYLGADFLRMRSAVIDCARMRLYLKN